MQDDKYFSSFLQEDGSYFYKTYRIWFEDSVQEFEVESTIFGFIEFYCDTLEEAFSYVDDQGPCDLEDYE